MAISEESSTADITAIAAQAQQYREAHARIRSEIQKSIVGQEEVIENVLTAIIIGGHVLLEGVPGLGKTYLVKTLSRVLDINFARIQFTPDLMPADIMGTNLIVETPTGGKEFRFQPGPVFANIVLADEINRATPKTQSALLEAMQEHSVTTGGEVRQLEEPFFVMATQNPIEMEGTYPLPEAQLDRFFFKINVPFPSLAELQLIVDRTTGSSESIPEKVIDRMELLRIRDFVRKVAVAPEVSNYAMRIVLSTHPGSPFAAESVKKYVRFGSSPRGAQTLVLGAKTLALLDGRYAISFSDIEKIARPALRHRVILNFEGEAEGANVDDILGDILKQTSQSAKS